MKINDESRFRASGYIDINAKRLQHLASLSLPIDGKTVLEVGAGPGDLSTFFLQRKCRLVTSDARPELVKCLEQRYPNEISLTIDLDDLTNIKPTVPVCQIVFAYGILYHLKNPTDALKFMSDHCSDMLLLETCVSWTHPYTVNNMPENPADFIQSYSGVACRPGRVWLFKTLSDLFEHVYVPRTQPNHSQFPIDWSVIPTPVPRLIRSVFVCSRQKLDNPLLADTLLLKHDRS